MLLNKHFNTDIKEEQIFGYSVTNFNESENLDDNNKEVNDFFQVLKTQIENENNTEKYNEESSNKFEFDDNILDTYDDNFLNTNKKLFINKEEIDKNLKTKSNNKSKYFRANKQLKKDDVIEIDFTKKGNKEQDENKLQKENKFQLESIKINTELYLFDKNKITGFSNEKYEYLLPNFFEENKEINKNDLNSKDDESNINLRNESNINSINANSSKKDIIRADRLTTSNKKQIPLDNFDSNNIIMNNLKYLSLDSNDYRGGKSFIALLDKIEKEKEKGKGNKTDIYLKSNINENTDSNNYENNYEINDYDNYHNYENFFNDNNKSQTNEEINEENDANILKDELENYLFFEKKNDISFTNIRDNLVRREKFKEPKIFYDLLLLAQKGDIDINQKEIMNNKSINISIK